MSRSEYCSTAECAQNSRSGAISLPDDVLSPLVEVVVERVPRQRACVAVVVRGLHRFDERCCIVVVVQRAWSVLEREPLPRAVLSPQHDGDAPRENVAAIRCAPCTMVT